jgi:putative ATP-dependent endonuclease of OLD family
MAELARVCGYELASEGVTCGLSAVLNVARHLAIEWHLLPDGNMAGKRYMESAREYTETDGCQDRFTLLHEPDVGRCL